MCVDSERSCVRFPHPFMQCQHQISRSLQDHHTLPKRCLRPPPAGCLSCSSPRTPRTPSLPLRRALLRFLLLCVSPTPSCSANTKNLGPYRTTTPSQRDVCVPLPLRAPCGVLAAGSARSNFLRRRTADAQKVAAVMRAV